LKRGTALEVACDVLCWVALIYFCAAAESCNLEPLLVVGVGVVVLVVVVVVPSLAGNGATDAKHSVLHPT
jgi:hypothetical protein